MSKPSPADELKRVQLEIPCSSAFISVARKTVETICSCLSLTKREVSDITLAVGEACSNAVKFSCQDLAPIRITCTLRPDCLEIAVRNRGKAFGKNREYPVIPPVEQLDRGGMGLYVISKVMDDLKVTSRNGLTTVRMVKKLEVGSRK